MGGRGLGGRERQGARNAKLFNPPLSAVSSSKRSEHTLPSIVNENTPHIEEEEEEVEEEELAED